MSELKFVDNARITLKENDDEYIYIQHCQLSPEINEMIVKQIYPSVDVILSIHIQASSIDPEKSICMTTVCWDGTSVQKIIGKHSIDGEYERISVEFM